MGLFKDMRNLRKQMEEMVPAEHRGLRGSMRLMRDGVSQAGEALSQIQDEGARAQHLMAHGVVGQGTITGLRDTGMTVNDNPRVEIDLTLSVPGREPYAVTHTQTISRIAVAGFQPGATVPVRVDPNDPSVMIIA